MWVPLVTPLTVPHLSPTLPALLSVMMPFLICSWADYLDSGTLTICAHSGLQKFITSSGDDSHTHLMSQKSNTLLIPPHPPPPKLSLPPKPKKGGGLFQLDTATVARSRTLPEIELSAGTSPVLTLVNILPGNTDSSPQNIINASPNLPPSQSVFPHLSLPC